MWAMIAVKSKQSSNVIDPESSPPIAESMSKSADFSSWGSPVKVCITYAC